MDINAVNMHDGKRFALKEADESIWSKNDFMEIQIMSRKCTSFNYMKLL
jgi:hypothetical protein